MYTIGQAAERCGVSVPVLRAWERRYGVVQPMRTPGGYRLYDEDALARLRAMHHLVTVEGWRPGQAASRVQEPGVDLRRLAGEDAVPGGRATATLPVMASDAVPVPGAVAAAGSPAPGELVRRVLAATRAFDAAALEGALDECFASRGFERAMEQVVFPALRDIGRAWRAGELDVAAEHATSESVCRRLARHLDAAGREPARPQVLVGLPPGDRHEIGALTFATAARRRGLGVLYLGADVPVESWSVALAGTTARVVVLGVTMAGDVRAAQAVLAAITAARGSPRCALGGPRAAAVQASGEVLVLPGAIDDAVAAVAALVAST